MTEVILASLFRQIWRVVLLVAFGLLCTASAGGQTTGTVANATFIPQIERAQASAGRPRGECSLSGRVLLGETSRPAARASLLLRYMNSQDIVIIAASDGSFIFKDIPAGEYWLAAGGAGLLQEYYNPKNVSGQVPRFKLSEKEKREGVVMSLRPCFQITGRVFDESGRPVASPDMEVVAWARDKDGNGAGFKIAAQVALSANGTYTLDGLDGRPVYVSAASHHADSRDGGYPVRYYPGTFSREEARLVLFAGITTVRNVDITLAKAGGLALEGTVVSAVDGSPIPKALLVVHHEDMCLDQVTGYTDDKGHYRIEGLGPGRFLVHVDAGPFGYVRTRQRVDFVQNNSAKLDFHLNKGVSVSGLLVDAQGKEVPVVHDGAFGEAILAVAEAKVPEDSFPGIWNRYGPVPTGNKRTFLLGETGDYDRVSMLFPNKSTFVVQGLMPGSVKLNFMAYKSGVSVQKILYKGRDVLATGLPAVAGDVIEGVQIVLSGIE